MLESGGKTRAAVLYFFPSYTHPKEFSGITFELRKRMTGKSCFDLPKSDQELLIQIRKMLKKAAIYRKIGWI